MQVRQPRTWERDRQLHHSLVSWAADGCLWPSLPCQPSFKGVLLLCLLSLAEHIPSPPCPLSPGPLLLENLGGDINWRSLLLGLTLVLCTWKTVIKTAWFECVVWDLFLLLPLYLSLVWKHQAPDCSMTSRFLADNSPSPTPNSLLYF